MKNEFKKMVLFGKEEINKYLKGVELTKLEKNINLKQYLFKNKTEFDFFIKD